AVEETIMKKFGQFQRLQQVEPVLEVPLNESRSLSLNQKILDNVSYLQLLKHLQKSHPQLRHYADLPHPSHSMVLQNLVCEPPYIPWRFGLKVSKRSPNNIIYLDNGKGEVEFARVAHILVLPNENILKGPLLMVDWLESVQEREVGFEDVDSFLASWNVKHLKTTRRPGVQRCFYYGLPN
ncbi:hypothetical protein O181_075717, partial [Austropuccinia psidii MF-1]|nr:hypothetical protein [Austropuccinia psidii MF-1]